MKRRGAFPVFLDCNAISPASSAKIAAIMAHVAAPYIDCGIIGWGEAYAPHD